MITWQSNFGDGVAQFAPFHACLFPGFDSPPAARFTRTTATRRKVYATSLTSWKKGGQDNHKTLSYLTLDTLVTMLPRLKHCSRPSVSLKLLHCHAHRSTPKNEPDDLQPWGGIPPHAWPHREPPADLIPRWVLSAFRQPMNRGLNQRLGDLFYPPQLSPSRLFVAKKCDGRP